MKFVICGFGSAGYAAALTIKKSNPKADVKIIDPKETDLFHPCGLPYALEGLIKPEDLLLDLSLHRQGAVKIRGRAEQISPENKTITVSTLEGEKIIEYGKLIIATGCSPSIPPISNLERYMNLSAFTFAGIRDLSFIQERMKTAENCVVIGGGAIGIETAYALRTHNKNVTIVEMENQFLNGILDPDMALMVESYLADLGITIIKGKRVTGLDGNECLKQVVCGDTILTAEMAIIASGFKPDTSLAKHSGIEVTSSGIKTDEMLKTSFDDIYAAGDCIINYSSIDGKPVISRLATSAFKQGSVAGGNVMGINERYRGTAGTFVTRIGSYEVAGTGFNTVTAASRGFEPASGKITSKIRPEYYPDNCDMTVKVIFDKNTGVILGAQCAGERGAAERVNLISMAIEFGITLDEFNRTEMAYAPPVSEVYDPLLRAVDFGVRRMKSR